MNRQFKPSKFRNIARRVKWQTWVALGMIIILSPIVYFTLLKPNKSEAAWWNGDWKYRTSIDITNNTTAETNVYTSHTIDTSDTTRFQADCGGIRFTTQQGKVMKYYVVSGCGGATTVLHVLHETLIAGRQTIYMYYGNLNADNGFEAADFSTVASNYTISATGSEETTPGPVAYWKFDEGQGQTINDQTTHRNAGTLGATSAVTTDDPTWIEEGRCVSGKCLQFDGSNDVVNMGDVLDFERTNAFSFNFWVKSPAGSGSLFVVAKQDNYNTGEGYHVSLLNTGIVQFFLANHGTANRIDIRGTTNVRDNKWHHVTTTYSGSSSASGVKIYVDGKAETTTTVADNLSGTTLTSENFQIGCREGCTLLWYNGFIDDLKIYPYARSAAEVKVDYNAGAAVLGAQDQKDFLSDGLVGYWPMDETAADSCTGGSNDNCDKSGNSKDLAWGNQATTITGKFGNGTTYDGTDDYASTALSGTTLTQTTVAFWVKPDTSQSASQVGIFQWANGLSSNIPFIYLARTNTGTSSLYVDGNYRVSNITAISNSVWNHVVITLNASNLWAIYVNGVSVGTYQDDATHSQQVFGTSVFWGNGYDGYFNGEIDDARIYNRALSADDVRNLYNWAPGPVGYWNFDEGSGQNVNDTSGYNGTAGTLGTDSSVGTDDPTWVTGKYGTGLNFDGSNDFVTFGDNANYDIGSSGLTFGGWIKTTDTSGGPIIKGGTAGGDGIYGYEIRVGSSSTDFFLFNTANGVHCNATTTTLVNNNVWRYVSATFIPGVSCNLYIDGVLVNSTTSLTGSVTTDTAADLLFGKRADNNLLYSGLLDEVRLYHYGRTSQQVVEDMNAGHPTGGSPVGSQVVKYEFDEQQGDTANNSVSANSTITGARSGATWKTKTNCKINGCLDFDGTDDVVTVTNTNAIDLNVNLASGFTWSAWINPDGAGEGSGGQVFYKGTNTWIRVDTLSGGKMDIQASLDLATTDATKNVTGVVTQSGWNHIALSYTDDTDDEITIWVNGNAVGTSTDGSGAPAADTANLLIGGNTTDNFDGRIDAVNIYNSELSKEQIGIDMTANSSVSYSVLGSSEQADLSDGEDDPPVLDFNFDEKTGQATSDRSGNGNAGTLGANSSIASDDPTWTSATGVPVGANGLAGSILSLDGTDDYVRVADSATLDITSAITMEVWVKPTAYGSGGTGRNILLAKGQTGLEFNYAIYAAADGSLYYANNTNIYDSTYDIPTGVWTHIAVTITGSSTIFYANGKQVGTAAAVLSAANTYPLGIGWDEAGNSVKFNGLMDGVKIYSYVRTPAQVAYDYNRGIPIGHWRLDECQGTTANDSSGNSNTGTITIGASGEDTVGTCSTSSTSWGSGITGKYNASLDLDGTDDFIDKGNISRTDIRTFSVWVKPASTTQKIAQLSASDSVEIVSGTVTVTGFGTETIYIDGIQKTTFPDTNWHLVTIVSSSDITANDVEFGRVSSTYFDGQIDDVRIFNYALGAAQVRKVYNENAAVRYGPNN